jgi:hypothetical protein
MTSKGPKQYNFWTISEITKAFCKDCTPSAIFMLDNEFLKDITKFKIDSSFILRVEFTQAKEIEYLKNSIPDLAILKLITRTKADLDKQNEIRIRGIQPTEKN